MRPPVVEPVRPLTKVGLPVPGWANALAVLPDGDRCVAATDSGLSVVSLSTGEVERVDSKRPAEHLALAGEGLLVSAGGFELRVWDTADWTVVKRLAYKGRLLTGVAAAEEFVVAGGWGGAWVWDIARHWRRRTLTDGEVVAVVTIADGQHAATVEYNGRVVLWSLREGKAVRTLRERDPGIAPIDWERPVDWEWELPLNQAYRTTALIDDTLGRLVVAGGELAAGPLATPGEVTRWGTTGRVRVAAMRPADGLVAAAVDDRIQLLDRDGDLLAVLGPTLTPVTALAFAPDGRLISAQTIGDILVWPAEVDQRASRRHMHCVAVWRTVIDSTGRYGRSIDGGGGTRLWDLRSGEDLTDSGLDTALRWYLPDGGKSTVAEYGVESPLESEDGSFAITVEYGPSHLAAVCCRNLLDGEQRWSWTPERAAPGWYPDWQVLPRHADVVLVCTTGHVAVLDQNTGQLVKRLKVSMAHEATPQTLPDGSVCLCYWHYSGTTTMLRLALLDWRTSTVQPYAKLAGDNALIAAEGLVITVAGNEVRLIDPNDGLSLGSVAGAAELEPSTLSISPDGRVVLMGDKQGGVHILHV
jgi:WD40 repeat protein